MFSSMYAGGIAGMEAYPVRVEVDISRGLPRVFSVWGFVFIREVHIREVF